MRLTAHGVSKFQHDGLVVGESFSEFDYARAEKKTQEAFRAFVGRFVRIHPDDVDELAKLGLALEGGRIVVLEPVKAEPVKAELAKPRRAKSPAQGDVGEPGDAGDPAAQGSGQ